MQKTTRVNIDSAILNNYIADKKSDLNYTFVTGMIKHLQKRKIKRVQEFANKTLEHSNSNDDELLVGEEEAAAGRTSSHSRSSSKHSKRSSKSGSKMSTSKKSFQIKKRKSKIDVSGHISLQEYLHALDNMKQLFQTILPRETNLREILRTKFFKSELAIP